MVLQLLSKCKDKEKIEYLKKKSKEKETMEYFIKDKEEMKYVSKEKEIKNDLLFDNSTSFFN